MGNMGADFESSVGHTNFKSGLLKSAIALGISEVSGARPVCTLFSRHGISIYNYDDSNDGVVINVTIWADYGQSVCDICYRVQESVINTATSMLDRKVKRVNVRIANVFVPYFEAAK